MQLKGASLLAAALALPGVSCLHAQGQPDRPVVSYKLLDYQDRQPGASRVHVRASAFGLTTPVGDAWSLTGTLVHDAISGASPAYHTSALTPLHDERRAADLSLTRRFERATVTFGLSASIESDYRSRGWSLQGSWASDDHNTTWTAGLGGLSDRITAGSDGALNDHKRAFDLVLGLTQVLGPRDIAQVDLGLRRSRGLHSDPYKVFDNRPRERDQHTLLVRWNHHVEASAGTLRSSWRYYGDSFGIRAHTLSLAYVQPLGQGWSVAPLLRLHTQTAARFYVDADPSSDPFAPNPPADAVYFSEDQRLSAFGARTVGLTLSKRLDADWLFDLKVEHCEQRGSWALFGSGSPKLSPFSARTVQFGVSRTF